MSEPARVDDPVVAELVDSLGLSPALIDRRLDVLGLTPEVRGRLRALAPQVRANAPAFLDAFYQRLLACPSTRAWLQGPAVVERLKAQQATYLVELFEAPFDWAHALRCLRLGVIHHRVRLTPQWFVASYGHFLCAHVPLILAADPSGGGELIVILLKSALFDAALVLDGYAMSGEREVRTHRLATALASSATAPTLGTPPAPTAGPAVTRARIASDAAAERAAFLGIDEAVVATLRTLGPRAEAALPGLLTQFYDLFATWDETAALVPPAVVARLRLQVRSYWLELFGGDFGRAYAASRTLVGIVHERVGLAAPIYLIGLARQVEHLVLHGAPWDAGAIDAVLRAVFFDVSFVLQAYVDARAEAVLRTDAFAAELLAGLTAGVAIVDAHLRVDAVNAALLSLFGLDPGLVRQARLEQVVPIPTSVELVRRAWQDPSSRRATVVSWQGRWFRISAVRMTAGASAAGEVVALVIDEISEVVRTVTEGQATEQSYAQVLDAVGALAWEADAATCTFTMVSRSAVDVTGHRDVALLGKAHAFTNLIPEPERAQFMARCRALPLGQRTELRHRLVRAEGAIAWIRTEVALVTGADGAPVLRGVSVDITAQRLEEQRRTQALGQLAGGFAHEFNNRLTVIQAGLELASDAALAPDLGELMREARIAAERCASLTREVLTFAQRQVLQPRPVVLNEVLGSASSALADLLGDAVELELALAPDLWTCNVDTAELTTAVGNLVRNARDSMPAGGRVTVATRNVPAVDLIDDAAHDLVELSIADTGFGMDESVQRRAFEPFFTTKLNGRGLGLSVVHGFVAQSGGRVSLASEVGRGTVVRLRFPRLAAVAVGAGDGDAGAGPVVLVVDDEPSLRIAIERLVRRIGYAVITVGTIGEALHVLRTRRVDVLLTDVVLADGERGPALVPVARALVPTLPVIYVSGFPREQLELAALGPRDHFLAKPFTRASLDDALAAALVLGVERRPRTAG